MKATVHWWQTEKAESNSREEGVGSIKIFKKARLPRFTRSKITKFARSLVIILDVLKYTSTKCPFTVKCGICS